VRRYTRVVRDFVYEIIHDLRVFNISSILEDGDLQWFLIPIFFFFFIYQRQWRTHKIWIRYKPRNRCTVSKQRKMEGKLITINSCTLFFFEWWFFFRLLKDEFFHYNYHSLNNLRWFYFAVSVLKLLLIILLRTLSLTWISGQEIFGLRTKTNAGELWWNRKIGLR